MLDPIIMTFPQYYREPEILAPLDPDPDKNGKPSDHNIVLTKPVSAINNKTARTTREISFRPISQMGLDKMKLWLIGEEWKDIYKLKTADAKADAFQKLLSREFKRCFLEKIVKVANDDQPWITQKLKTLDRQRKRCYHKSRRSNRWKNLNKQFKKELKVQKSNFYKKMASDLKEKDPKKWYSVLKRITTQEKEEEIIIPEIEYLSNQEQCELIADEFARVPNEYSPLHTEDITIPDFQENDIPQFSPAQVWQKLTNINANKSSTKGDVPAKILKLFAAYFAEPLSHIINCSILSGQYPDIWKIEIATPIPKTYPTLRITDLRNISGLLNCDKIAEKLISELIMEDMKNHMDKAQYGNMKKKSINHYLINMIHRILSALDNNSRRDIFAVVANLIDWSKAFPRQCPQLGVQSFIDNNVRPALIPVLVSFFQNHQWG